MVDIKHPVYGLKNLLDDRFTHVQFDDDLYKRLLSFKQNWMSRSDDHSLFLGGTIIGAYRLSFTGQDDLEIAEEILGLDLEKLQNDIWEVKGVVKEHKIASNAMNIIFMYVAYRFFTNKKISERIRTEGAKVSIMLFNYRAFAKLHSRYFTHLLSQDAAQSTYDSLSGRYIIKKVGNWENVFIHRAMDIIDKHGVNHDKIVRFKTKDVLDTIADMQGKIRSMLKNIYSEMTTILKAGTRLKMTNIVEEIPGSDVSIKSLTEGSDRYVDYLLNIIHDKNTFVMEEHINIAVKIINTANDRNLRKTLLWLVDNYDKDKYNRQVKKMIKSVIVLSTRYLSGKGLSDIRLSDLALILGYLKGYWLSSRADDSEVIELRKSAGSLVKKALNRNTKTIISSTRNALFIYLYMRALVGVK